jgi:hypothetical protein
MYEIQAQVLGVEGKQTSKGTIYEVAMSDGKKYGAWEGDLAAKAHGLMGQLVDARVEYTQNSKNGKTYDNYTLKEIGVPGSLPAQAVPGVPGALIPIPGVGAPPVTANIPMQAPSIPDAERQKLIVRQSVLSTAHAFVAAIYNGAGPEALVEAEEHAARLASVLYGRVFATPVPAPVTPVSAPVPTTPAEVAAQVPGVQVGVQGDASEGQLGTPTAPTPEW